MAAPSGLAAAPMAGGVAGAPSWRFVDTPLNETLYRCFCYGQAALTLTLTLALTLVPSPNPNPDPIRGQQATLN
jgi:hypothetical protein